MTYLVWLKNGHSMREGTDQRLSPLAGESFMIFVYVLEKVIHHSFEIGAFAVAAWLFSKPRTIGGTVGGIVILVVLMGAYVGMVMENRQTSEDWIWVGLSLLVGTTLGAFVAYRQRRTRRSGDR